MSVRSVLTSHGSEDHEFYINQPPLPLDPLTPQRLRVALDASGIRWRVIVVSACYSGGYIEALRAGREQPQWADLNYAERRLLCEELEGIMAVYGDKGDV